jgi:hypothetical protein
VIPDAVVGSTRDHFGLSPVVEFVEAIPLLLQKFNLIPASFLVVPSERLFP